MVLRRARAALAAFLGLASPLPSALASPPAATPAPPSDPREALDRAGLPFDEKTWWERVDAGDAPAIRLFLAAGFPPGTRNAEGRTALFVAVDRADAPAVEALLSGGADPNDAGEGPQGLDLGETLALRAVAAPDAAILKALVAKGTDVRKGNRYAVTPLHDAAREGKLEMVEVLLAAGANPNARAAGAPLLFGPVTEDRVDVVRLLLKKGARVGKDRQLLTGAARSPAMTKLLRSAR